MSAQFHFDPDGYLEMIRGEDGKRDLFRRVREQSRSLVIADVVKADVSVAPIEPGFDFPDRATDLAEWAGGEVIWQAEDLAVLVARYE